MAGNTAIADDAAMVEAAGKAFGAVTGTAVGGRGRMGRNRGRLGRRIDAVAFVVAGVAALHRGIHQPVVENTAHIEAGDAVTNTAIDGRQWMAGRRTDGRYTMAGVAGYPGSDDRGAGMIGERVQETVGRMAGNAFNR